MQICCFATAVECLAKLCAKNMLFPIMSS